jgi:hypothetical protein
MKFGYACTFADKRRGETPAPPFKKRTPVLPRLPACRALSRQIGKCIFRAMLAVFRTGRRQHLAFGGHVLGPGLPYLAAQQKRYNRRLSYPPPSHKACLENIYWARPIARSAPPCLRAPDAAATMSFEECRRMTLADKNHGRFNIIPAKAGIHGQTTRQPAETWVPAFAHATPERFAPRSRRAGGC